jgi:glycosyltransferase involved in cell wall biosynthesis
VLFGGVSATSNPRKGFRELQSALSRFSSSAIRPTVCVFGGVADAAQFALPVISLGRLDQEELADAYSAADVLVTPSLQENLANVMLEGLSCGTPVVAFDIGGMPDAISHKQNGYLAVAGDAADLAKGIEWVLGASSDLRSSLSTSARQTAMERFSRTSEVSSYLRLYEELADQHRRDPADGT